MKKLDYQVFYERDLPHYQPPGATIFITFRLAGSLPEEIMQRFRIEATALNQQITTKSDPNIRIVAPTSIQWELFEKMDHELGASNSGPKWLSNPILAGMVCEAMQYWDGKKYVLEAYCVMPNHVHLVCTPSKKNECEYPLSDVLHSIKSYTAH